MKMWMLLTLAASGLGLTPVGAAGGEIKVEPDKENVVASRLEGRWQIDTALTKRLTGKERTAPAEGGEGGPVISVKSDPAVAAKIPAKYEKFLANKRVYMAGMVSLGGKKDREHPFILIEHRGNPHVVFFRERDGDPLGDTESFNVMLAVAKEKENDLLFIGGDFNNQPFSGCARAPDEKKK